MTPGVPSVDALAGLAEAFRLQQAGKLDDAEAAYAKILASQPDDAVALINAGALAIARNDLDAAIVRLQRATALVPKNPVALNNLGFALLRAARNDDALSALDRATKLKPDYAQAHNNRGIALAQLSRYGDAIVAFARALSLDPGFVDAAINLGDARASTGDPAGAVAAYAAALGLDPTHTRALSGHAFATALSGDLDGAQRALERVVSAHPNDAAAWQTLAAIRNWSWDHEAAEAAYRRASDLQPDNHDARFGIASTLLARGRYAEGFAAFEHRPGGTFDRSPRFANWPAWDGKRLDGTLLVHAEQGFGDVLQFARFVPDTRRDVARVVLLVDGDWKALAPLLAASGLADRVASDIDELSDESIAASASILSLPHVLGVTLDTLDRPIPYLSAPANRAEAWRKRLSGVAHPRIGLAWSVLARDRHAFVTRHKSIPPRLLAPLLDVPGVAWVTLQPGAAGDPRQFAASAPSVFDGRREIRDFADTAALIAETDLVVAPDTAVAHLAGALGKPVWLLDRYNSCWRWRVASDTSPWYPTMTIFRQTRFGEWTDVIEQVRGALRQWLSAKGTKD